MAPMLAYRGTNHAHRAPNQVHVQPFINGRPFINHHAFISTRSAFPVSVYKQAAFINSRLIWPVNCTFSFIISLYYTSFISSRRHRR